MSSADKIQYTCHPVRNWKIGKFKFTDSLMTLEDEEAEAEFLSVIDHKNFPKRDRHTIKKLDFAAAELISKKIQDTNPKVTQVIDSSVGARAGDAPKIGLGDLLKRAAPVANASDGAGEVDPAGDESTQAGTQE